MDTPINYSVDVGAPVNAVLQGYNQGLATQANQLQLQQAQQQMQMQQAALARQAQMRSDLSALSANPNASAKDFSSITLKYPELDKQLKQSWDMLSTDQQQNKISHGVQVYSALQAGKPDIAQNLLTEQAAAARNSGDEQGAKGYENMRDLIVANPDQAKNVAGLTLSSLMGPDKFESTFSGLGTFDAKQKEGQSNAEKAAVAAKYADSQAAQDLQKGGWEIKKIQNDIDVSRQNVAIANMEAKIKAANSDIERQKLGLELNKMQFERDQLVRDKAATASAGQSSIDNALDTVDRINKLDPKVLDNVLGPVDSRLPTLRDDTANAEALIDTLGSQAFIAQIPNLKGTGSLSEREGDKLQASLQNLSKTQTREQFMENLHLIQRLMMKARTNLSTRYGVPQTVPDTPSATPEAGEVDAILKKYGVKQAGGASGNY